MFDGFYNAFWFLVIRLIFVAVNLWVSSLIRPSDPHAGVYSLYARDGLAAAAR